MNKPFILALALCLPAASVAGERQSHDSIQDAARQHVEEKTAQFGGKVSIKVSPLDRRLRLAACDQPLQTYESPNGLRPGRSVVGVRCEGTKPWKIYVSVNIATLQNVVVSKHALPKGQLLSSADLVLTERDTARIHKSFYTDPMQLQGLQTKRGIRAGKIITPGMLARNRLVRRGSDVEILARSGNLHVRMRGKAMANGALGERIRVKNISSGREVTGTIIDPGVILVQQ